MWPIRMTPFPAGGGARGMAPLTACILVVACLYGPTPGAAQDAPRPAAPSAAPAQQDLTVDALSVVRVRAKALANARSMRTLGPQREGSGVVIDASGLVLTIGYLILE